MPRGDGSGPNGMGPMTGRGAGFCAGAGVPGYANPSFGRGFGGGRGGRGMRNRFWATGMTGWQRAQAMGYGPEWVGPYAQPPMTSAQERDMLNSRIQELEGGLEQMRARLSDLDNEPNQKK